MGEQVHVLVVDDQDAVRSSVAEILRGAGYRVSEASDVASGLAVLAAAPVAVIVLDIRLSDGDGMDLLDAMESSPRVVLMSGLPLAGEAGVGRDPRVYSVVNKPFRPQLLLDAVAGAVGIGMES